MIVGVLAPSIDGAVGTQLVMMDDHFNPIYVPFARESFPSPLTQLNTAQDRTRPTGLWVRSLPSLSIIHVILVLLFLCSSLCPF